MIQHVRTFQRIRWICKGLECSWFEWSASALTDLSQIFQLAAPWLQCFPESWAALVVISKLVWDWGELLELVSFRLEREVSLAVGVVCLRLGVGFGVGGLKLLVKYWMLEGLDYTWRWDWNFVLLRVRSCKRLSHDWILEIITGEGWCNLMGWKSKFGLKAANII